MRIERWINVKRECFEGVVVGGVVVGWWGGGVGGWGGGGGCYCLSGCNVSLFSLSFSIR